MKAEEGVRQEVVRRWVGGWGPHCVPSFRSSGPTRPTPFWAWGRGRGLKSTWWFLIWGKRSQVLWESAQRPGTFSPETCTLAHLKSGKGFRGARGSGLELYTDCDCGSTGDGRYGQDTGLGPSHALTHLLTEGSQGVGTRRVPMQQTRKLRLRAVR